MRQSYRDVRRQRRYTLHPPNTHPPLRDSIWQLARYHRCQSSTSVEFALESLDRPPLSAPRSTRIDFALAFADDYVLCTMAMADCAREQPNPEEPMMRPVATTSSSRELDDNNDDDDANLPDWAMVLTSTSVPNLPSKRHANQSSSATSGSTSSGKECCDSLHGCQCQPTPAEAREFRKVLHACGRCLLPGCIDLCVLCLFLVMMAEMDAAHRP